MEPPSWWEGDGASSLRKRSIVWKHWEPGEKDEFVKMKEVFPKLIEKIIYEKIDFKTFKKRTKKIRIIHKQDSLHNTLAQET